MADKTISKLYRRIVTAKSQYHAYRIAEQLKPEQAKQVLLSFIVNQK